MKEKVENGQSQACCKTWITIIISPLSPWKSDIIHGNMSTGVTPPKQTELQCWHHIKTESFQRRYKLQSWRERQRQQERSR